nr:PH domain-containing protein [Actinomycetota bacterium]
ELRIEAIGGDSTEANLVALAPGEAERVREALLAGALEDKEVGRDEAAPPLASLGPSELSLAGLTGGRVAVLALLLGYLQEVASESFVGGVAERVFARGAPGVVVVIGAALVFLFVSLVFSIAATVLVYWGFTVTQEGDRLVIVRGLLERRRATVPLRRIQAVQLQENLVRRVFGLASLTVVVAGYSGPKEEQQETSMLLPIARRAEALALAGRVLGTRIDLTPSSWEPVPARAMLRRLWFPGALALAAGGAATLRLGSGGILVFALLPAVGLASLLGWRALAHTVTGAHAAVRSGVLIGRTTIVPLANVQQLKLTASPLQRLHGLASVRLHVPKSTAHAADLDEARARGRFEELTRALL